MSYTSQQKEIQFLLSVTVNSLCELQLRKNNRAFVFTSREAAGHGKVQKLLVVGKTFVYFFAWFSLISAFLLKL